MMKLVKSLFTFPTLWSKAHLIYFLPTVIIDLITAYIFGLFLRNQKDKIKIIPIRVLVSILVVFDFYKFFYHVARGEFNPFDLPLHNSSLMLYLGSIFSFYSYNRTNKLAKAINSIFYAYCLMQSLFMLLNPNVVFDQGVFDNAMHNVGYFHSIYYHCACYLITFLVIFLRFMKSDIIKDFIYVLPFIFCFDIFEAIMANWVGCNWNNFAWCNIAFVENWRQGWVKASPFFGQTLYVRIMCVFNQITYVVSIFAMKLIDIAKPHVIYFDDKLIEQGKSAFNKIFVKLFPKKIKRNNKPNLNNLSINSFKNNDIELLDYQEEEVLISENHPDILSKKEKKLSLILYLSITLVCLGVTIPLVVIIA